MPKLLWSPDACILLALGSVWQPHWAMLPPTTNFHKFWGPLSSPMLHLLSLVNPVLLLLLQISVQASLSWENFPDLWTRSNLPIIQMVSSHQVSVPLQCLSQWPFLYVSIWLFDLQSVSSTRPWASWWQRLCLFNLLMYKAQSNHSGWAFIIYIWNSRPMLCLESLECYLQVYYLQNWHTQKLTNA